MAAVCWVPGALAPAFTAIAQADWPWAGDQLGSLWTKRRRLEFALELE